MPISLYDAVIPSYLQGIGSVETMLDKAEAFCAERGGAPETLLQARLIEDMFPFTYQVKSVAFHSFGAIEGVRKGEFSPDFTPPPESFAGLRDSLSFARQGLGQVTKEEMEDLIGRPMRFFVPQRDFELPFTVENFLLSFSMPNFMFHLTTAYDLLRQSGVALGKIDFLGLMRIGSPVSA